MGGTNGLMSPALSVVVPVHNEELILEEQVSKMISTFREMGLIFEILLVENGSSDRTPIIAQQMVLQVPELRILRIAVADYGVALRQGIIAARHDVVVIFNVEFWSAEFVEIALTALRSRALVVGSKSAPGGHDDRGLLRRIITRTYNLTLRFVWGFDGTDTHGLKAFRGAALLPLVERCVTSGWVFDTELVLRAQRAGISKLELPTEVGEIRAPTTWSLLRRVPRVISNLWLLSRHVPPHRRAVKPLTLTHGTR